MTRRAPGAEPHGPTWQGGGWTVRALGRALHLDDGRQGWLVGVPEGVVDHLDDPARDRLHGLVLPGDDTADLSGWIGLLDALDRDGLVVLHPMTAQRATALVEAWSRGWPDGVSLSSDAAVPGLPMDIEGLTVRFDGSGGVRIDLGGPVLARTGTALPLARRMAEGADLVVVVVKGTAPVDLARLSGLPGDVWVLDEQGRPWSPAAGGDA